MKIGETTASLYAWGTEPEVRDLLMTVVRIGARMSTLAFSRSVGRGSTSGQYLLGALRMYRDVSSIETSLKQLKLITSEALGVIDVSGSVSGGKEFTIFTILSLKYVAKSLARLSSHFSNRFYIKEKF